MGSCVHKAEVEDSINLSFISSPKHQMVQDVDFYQMDKFLIGYIRKTEQGYNMLIPNVIKEICFMYLSGQTQIYKICLLGAGNVGLSAIVNRLINDEFINIYDPTVENIYDYSMRVDGQLAPIKILDTGGQQLHFAYLDQWIQTNHAFIIIYSCINRYTFEYCKQLWKQIAAIHQNGQSVVAMLCGTKCDDLIRNGRQISFEEGEDLANSWNIPFIETSAKTGKNVTKMFEIFIREMRKKRWD